MFPLILLFNKKILSFFSNFFCKKIKRSISVSKVRLETKYSMVLSIKLEMNNI